MAHAILNSRHLKFISISEFKTFPTSSTDLQLSFFHPWERTASLLLLRSHFSFILVQLILSPPFNYLPGRLTPSLLLLFPLSSTTSTSKYDFPSFVRPPVSQPILERQDQSRIISGPAECCRIALSLLQGAV